MHLLTLSSTVKKMQIDSSQNMQLVTAAVMASLEFASEGFYMSLYKSY